MARKLKSKKKKVSNGGIEINTKEFIKFMRKVYLGGIFEEAFFAFNGKDVSTQLIDLTNTMFISCSEEDVLKTGLKKDSLDLGIGDLGLLLKFFNTVSQDVVTVDKKGNRIIIKRDDGTNLSYLLTESSVIPTIFKREDKDETPEDKLFEKTDYEIELEEKTRNDFNLYIGMIKTRDVELTLSKGVVGLVGGADTEHQFKVVIGEVDEDKEEFSMKFYGDFIQKLFAELDYGEDAESPVIHFGEGSAFIVVQGEYTWAIVPIG